jgi:alginate O-acetyltransferase complex protein AlgI
LTLAVLRQRRRLGRPINAGAQRTPAGFASMIGAPIVATMLLVGLWHGATGPFVVFALLHTGFLLLNHAWRLVRAPSPPIVASALLTYACVLAASVVFRSESLATAGAMFAAMTGAHGLGPVGLDARSAADIAWLAGLYAIVWFAPTTRQFMTGGAGRFAWRPLPRYALAMGCAATLALLAAGGTGEFLYFRF